jgi:hypothetical protein
VSIHRDVDSTAGHPRRPLVAIFIAVLVVLAGVVFIPPLRARFVSDTFVLYEFAKQQSLLDALSQYVPHADRWYRPTTELVFWLEAHVFATVPLGYHLIALGCHVLSSVLIYGLVRRLSGVRIAAAIAALTFLFQPHAHEPLWDIADLHTALAGPVLLAAVLAYVTGRRWPAVFLSIGALTVDESGLLAVALIAVYEVTVLSRLVERRFLIDVALRLAPFILVAVAYIGTRLLAGSIFSELTDPCRSPKCLVVAAAEYFNRFYVRPDAFLRDIWVLAHRITFVAVGVVLGLMLLVALRPWAWARLRPAAFAVGWLVVSSLFFILTLWPYIPDRFLYIPDMGLAMLIGAGLAELPKGWRVGTAVAKLASSARQGCSLHGLVWASRCSWSGEDCGCRQAIKRPRSWTACATWSRTRPRMPSSSSPRSLTRPRQTSHLGTQERICSTTACLRPSDSPTVETT